MHVAPREEMICARYWQVESLSFRRSQVKELGLLEMVIDMTVLEREAME